MSNFQPYIFHPEGEGVYAPVRQALLKWKDGNFSPSASAELWRKQKRKPHPFASAITSRYNITDVIPSEFSQAGKGKKHPKVGAPKSIKIGMIKPGDINYGGKMIKGKSLGLNMRLFT